MGMKENGGRKETQDGRKWRTEGYGGWKKIEDGRKLDGKRCNMKREKHVKEYYFYKDLFTHKDIHTYINGVV